MVLLALISVTQHLISQIAYFHIKVALRVPPFCIPWESARLLLATHKLPVFVELAGRCAVRAYPKFLKAGPQDL